jgi:hypothetical protein
LLQQNASLLERPGPNLGPLDVQEHG